MTPESIEVTMRQINEAAKRINPATAEMVWWYAQVVDPYGLMQEVPAEEYCIGRQCFLVDPDERFPILVYEVRELHPEVSDDEWDALMRAASDRDDSPDPFPRFQSYR